MKKGVLGVIVQVSVPCNTMPMVVTVRCGHCVNLLSVNIGALLQSLPPIHHHHHPPADHHVQVFN